MPDSHNIYSIEVDYDNFKSFMPKDLSVSVRCKGQPLNWNKTLEIVPDEEDTGMPIADISMLNIGSFLISRSLFDDLFGSFKSDFELLPLSLHGSEYYLCNVVNVIDGLNKERSSFNAFGGVSDIIFDANKLPREGFFKIAEDNYTSIFCTENIKNIIEKNSLSGIELDKFDAF
jgi:hypothetical protein